MTVQLRRTLSPAKVNSRGNVRGTEGKPSSKLPVLLLMKYEKKSCLSDVVSDKQLFLCSYAIKLKYPSTRIPSTIR